MTNSLTRPIRFGVLGAAKIAPKALIGPLAKLDGVEITRVAARDRSRAEAYAVEHGIAGTAVDYQELVESDDVDVVYNPLPMSLHAEWTIAALKAGKDVLCEKPFAANADEAGEMVKVASAEGRKLGEAFHHLYHPLFAHLRDQLASGCIGDLRRVESVFNVPVDRSDFRWDYAAAGGALMDLGCYPVSSIRRIVGQEPTVVSATAVEGPKGIDASLQAELAFESGVTAHLSTSMEAEFETRLSIEGTQGRIVVTNPFAPQHGNTIMIETKHGVSQGPFDAGTTYEHMVRAFVDHVVHDTPFSTSGQDSINNMAAIDAIYVAAGLPIRGLDLNT